LDLVSHAETVDALDRNLLNTTKIIWVIPVQYIIRTLLIMAIQVEVEDTHNKEEVDTHKEEVDTHKDQMEWE